MELDFTAVAVDVDGKTTPKDTGCYVHMDGELLDVITPIRDKIGMENILTVRIADRPATLKLIVKRMGDLEELLGSASVPLTIFASVQSTAEFQRIWVKLSSDADSDLFIPTPTEEVEKPRIQIAYRTKGKTPQVEAKQPVNESPERLQQVVWALEAELEVTKTELRYEQEKSRQNHSDALKRAEDRIRELETQLRADAQPVSPKQDTQQKYSELLSQYKAFIESQRTKEQATDARLKELLTENAALKGDLAAKQHHVSTLVSEITYLKQSMVVMQAEQGVIQSPPTAVETSSMSEVTDEIAELQQRLAAFQSENAKLRKDMEAFSHPPAKPEPARTPKNSEGKPVSPKKPPSDNLEASLNTLLPKYGFTKVSRVVEGIYLLANRRIHAKMQGGVLVTQLGGSADWLPADELLNRLKEEGEAKSLRRSISVGQENDIKASPEDQTTPRKVRREGEEEAKAKPQLASKIMRDFSPILKKKK